MPAGSGETPPLGLGPGFRNHASPVSCDGSGAILSRCDFSARAESVPPRIIGGDIVAVEARIYRHDSRYDDPADAIHHAVTIGGTDALARLEGDFSFAIWRPAISELILGRDGFGVRPLYYVCRPGGPLAFASSAEMLCAAGLASPEADIGALAYMVTANFGSGARTCLADLRRVPPGHILRYRDGRIATERYWRPEAVAPLARGVSFDAAAEELRSRLDTAVRLRLPSEGQTASHMSGGLDSSAIAVLAGRALEATGGELAAYSVQAARDREMPDLIDEAPYTAALAQQNPALRLVAVPASTPGQHATAPLAAAMPVPDHDEHEEAIILEDAAGRGVRVIFSGFGGDEAASYNGRGALAEDLVRFRWRRMLGELRALQARSGDGLFRLLARHAGPALLPDGLRRRLQSLFGRRTASDLDWISSFMKPEHRKTVARDIGPDTRRNRLRLISGGHIGASLEYFAERGSRYGIAYAFPLLDREVVAYALSLPTEFFIRGGVNRAIFREAMQGVLPEMVRTRRAKLMRDPAHTLRAAEVRDTLLETAAALRQSPAADLFDFARLEAAIHDIPDVETLRKALAESTEAGRQPDNRASAVAHLLTLARFAGRRAD